MLGRGQPQSIKPSKASEQLRILSHQGWITSRAAYWLNKEIGKTAHCYFFGPWKTLSNGSQKGHEFFPYQLGPSNMLGMTDSHSDSFCILWWDDDGKQRQMTFPVSVWTSLSKAFTSRSCTVIFCPNLSTIKEKVAHGLLAMHSLPCHGEGSNSQRSEFANREGIRESQFNSAISIIIAKDYETKVFQSQFKTTRKKPVVSEIPGAIFRNKRTALSTTGSQGGLPEIPGPSFQKEQTALSMPAT